jgi:hypothetical protein
MSMPGDDRVEEVLEDGPARYAAYANRLRTLLVASSRYVAYSSGEHAPLGVGAQGAQAGMHAARMEVAA